LDVFASCVECRQKQAILFGYAGATAAKRKPFTALICNTVTQLAAEDIISRSAATELMGKPKAPISAKHVSTAPGEG
jgi:hypothetical protein